MILLGRKPEHEETVTYIELCSICDRFNSLPSEGGVLDQDQLIMRKLMIVMATQQEKQQQMEKKRGK